MKTTLLIALLCLLAPITKASASDYFVSVNLGVFKNFSAFDSAFQFDFGGKAAAKLTHLEGFSDLWAALGYNHTASNPAGTITNGNSELMLQPLFMNVSGSDFYFGPQVGFDFVTLGSNTTTEFAYGVLAGLMLPISEKWSIAPEASLTRFNNFGESQTALKVLVGATLAL